MLVAPFSGEDERRIAALNAGERAMAAGADASAAQLQRELQTAAIGAALDAAPPAPLAAPRKRFCTACGAEAAAGARFCSNCAAPIAAG